MKTAGREAGQLARLRALLRVLIPDNAFYSRKLSETGATPELSSLAEFSARIPFTLKSELAQDQKAHPPFGSNLTYPLERYTRFSQTSGTSTEPLRWLDTAEDWEWMLGNWSVVYGAAGVKAGDCIFFAFSFGPFLGFWTAFEAAERLGCLCIPGGGLSSESRLQMITRTCATVLCCTPTYALRLGELAAGSDTTAVRTIIVAGEPGGSIRATRTRIENLWPGARVLDHHGMTEVGPVTYECPSRPGTLCVIEPSYFAEVIDPATAEPVGENETGELVLTPLGRTGSPLLRYRTGDLVKKIHVDGVLAFEGGILGRSDEMITLRGVNIYPTAVEAIIRSRPEIAEYRVELCERDSMEEMHVTIEPAAGCPDPAGLARNLEIDFKNAFALRVPVSVAEPGTLPRFEMKAKRWVRAK